MSDLSNTQFFQVEPGPQISAKDILEIVFLVMKVERDELVEELLKAYIDHNAWE